MSFIQTTLITQSLLPHTMSFIHSTLKTLLHTLTQHYTFSCLKLAVLREILQFHMKNSKRNIKPIRCNYFNMSPNLATTETLFLISYDG